MEKLTPSLAQAMAAAAPQHPLGIIVRYRPDAARPQSLLASARVRYHYRLLAASALEASPDLIQTLSEDPAVERIWLDEPVYTCLDTSTVYVGAPPLWIKGLRGRGVKVAVIDTGIDPDHPDFSNRIAAMADFTGGNARDDNGHGTHVAGIIAGDGSAMGGKYRGVAPEATLLVAKVLRADGAGMMSDVIAGVEWAVDQGAQVINLSLGGVGSSDGQDALSTACNAAVEHGTVVCAAAGNAGPNPYTIGSPGAAELVITVGAIDEQDHVPDFSSRGPTADGRIKPDILFPGVNITSCRAAGTSIGQPISEHYTQASGTSMATPHASGVVALLLQAKPDLTPGEVKALLMNTALSLGLDPNTQGAGRGRANTAYNALPHPSEEPQRPSEPKGCFPRLLRLFGA